MSAKNKTPKLKPRRMWANYWDDFVAIRNTKEECENSLMAEGATLVAVPVAVIPLDDVEGLVEKAYQAALNDEVTAPTIKEGIRAALTAIGVIPKRKKGGRK